MEMNMKEVGRRVDAAAMRIARTGSRLAHEDLRQQAWLAVCEARRGFDESRGTPFEAYAWQAAWRQAWRAEQRAARRDAEILTSPLPEVADDAPHPDRLAEHRRWSGRMGSQLALLVTTDRERDLLALAIGNLSGAEIARAWGVRADVVYKAGRAFRRRLAADERLRDLWADRPEEMR